MKPLIFYDNPPPLGKSSQTTIHMLLIDITTSKCYGRTVQHMEYYNKTNDTPPRVQLIWSYNELPSNQTTIQRHAKCGVVSNQTEKKVIALKVFMNTTNSCERFYFLNHN